MSNGGVRTHTAAEREELRQVIGYVPEDARMSSSYDDEESSDLFSSGDLDVLPGQAVEEDSSSLFSSSVMSSSMFSSWDSPDESSGNAPLAEALKGLTLRVERFKESQYALRMKSGVYESRAIVQTRKLQEEIEKMKGARLRRNQRKHARVARGLISALSLICSNAKQAISRIDALLEEDLLEAVEAVAAEYSAELASEDTAELNDIYQQLHRRARHAFRDLKYDRRSYVKLSGLKQVIADAEGEVFAKFGPPLVVEAGGVAFQVGGETIEQAFGKEAFEDDERRERIESLYNIIAPMVATDVRTASGGLDAVDVKQLDLDDRQRVLDVGVHTAAAVIRHYDLAKSDRRITNADQTLRGALIGVKGATASVRIVNSFGADATAWIQAGIAVGKAAMLLKEALSGLEKRREQMNEAIREIESQMDFIHQGKLTYYKYKARKSLEKDELTAWREHLVNLTGVLQTVGSRYKEAKKKRRLHSSKLATKFSEFNDARTLALKLVNDCKEMEKGVKEMQAEQAKRKAADADSPFDDVGTIVGGMELRECERQLGTFKRSVTNAFDAVCAIGEGYECHLRSQIAAAELLDGLSNWKKLKSQVGRTAEALNELFTAIGEVQEIYGLETAAFQKATSGIWWDTFIDEGTMGLIDEVLAPMDPIGDAIDSLLGDSIKDLGELLLCL